MRVKEKRECMLSGKWKDSEKQKKQGKELCPSKKGRDCEEKLEAMKFEVLSPHFSS